MKTNKLKNLIVRIPAGGRAGLAFETPLSIESFRALCRVALLAAIVILPCASRADFHVWTGAVNGYWSNSNNWQSGDAPHLFESTPVYIEFPSGVARTVVTNDIYYGIFGAVYVDTFIVTGNNYVISGIGNGTNIVMTGNPAPFFGLNLQNFYCTGTGITFDQSLNIYLEGTNTITNNVGSTLEMDAALTGTGGWNFEGLGTMTLGGSNQNTFSGACQVSSGTLILNHTAAETPPGFECISGPLTIGTTNTSVPAVVMESGITGQFIRYDTMNGIDIYTAVSILPSGTFRILGAGTYPSYWPNETIGSLTMTGGKISLEGLAGQAYGASNTGTNYARLNVTGPININPCPISSTITGHGLGSDLTGFVWDIYQSAGFDPGDESSNVINVASNAALVMDTPISTYNIDQQSYLSKTGGGTLLTTGTNNYAGSTYIQQGIWAAAGDTPFGTVFDYQYSQDPWDDYLLGPANNQVVVSAGGEILALSPFNSPIPLVLNGQGIGGTGAALNFAANGTTFSAGCTLGSDTTIFIGSGNTGYFDNSDNTNGDVVSLAGVGMFHKQGPGTLALTMSMPLPFYYLITNEFSGTTIVDEGTLLLAGQTNTAMLNGPLYISDVFSSQSASVQLQAPEQIASNSPVTIFDGGYLDLSGGSQTVGSLDLFGGSVEFGTIILRGDLTAENGLNAPGFVFANLSLGGTNRTINVYPSSTLTMLGGILDGGNNAGFTKTGAGQLALGGSGTYGGMTIVSAGTLSVQNGSALGGSSGTVVSPGAELDLGSGVFVGPEPLTISGTGVDGLGALKGSGTNSWAGPISLTGSLTIQNPTNAFMELSGAISGTGGLTRIGQGMVLLDGSQSNSFSGITLIQQGVLELSKTNALAIPGPITIGEGLDGPNGDVLRTLQPNQLTTNTAVTISSSGLFDVSLGSITRVGSITGTGSLQMNASQFVLGQDNSSSSLGGSISGFGDFTKAGTGTFTYTGTGSYAGNFDLTGGQLFVNGSLASAAIFSYAGTTLGGSGSVGPISSFSGLVTPGNYNPGILNSGSLTLGSNDTLLVYITGTNAGSGYSQLDAPGSISLGNAHLQLNMSVLGATNTLYTLIHNPTTHPVTGTFVGASEGSTVVANNGVRFKITYHGGAGNDVVLTQTSLIPASPTLAAVGSVTNGNFTLTGTGSPNVTYHVQANTNLATTNWVTLGPVTANNLGALIFTDSQAGSYVTRFYRVVYP
jgi:autotransporter-associated beta strand protein